MSASEGYPAGKSLSNAGSACAACGKQCETSPFHPRQKFCSIKCYKKVWNARNRPRKQPEARACAECGKAFETPLSQKKFCSAKCRDKDHYKRHRARYYRYTRAYRAAHPEKARQGCRRYYAKHRMAQNADSRRRYAEKTRKLAEAERILAEQQPNPRITLAVCLELQGLKKYAMKDLVFADLHYPNAAKQRAARKARTTELFRRHAQEFDCERQRLASLPENERLSVAERAASQIIAQKNPKATLPTSVRPNPKP
jgi:hypothetical protein